MKVFVVCLLAICLTFTCANTLFDEDDLPIDDAYASIHGEPLYVDINELRLEFAQTSGDDSRMVRLVLQMANNMELLEKKMDVQMEMINRLEDKVRVLEEKVQTKDWLIETIMKTEQPLQSDESETNIKTEAGTRANPATNLRTAIRHVPKVVAFSTVLSHGLIHLGQHQRIKFDKILLNEGDGYNVHTGSFKAPTSGVYLFIYNFGHHGKGETWLELMKNGERQNSAAVEGSFSSQNLQSGNAAIIRLHVGDLVWVQTFQVSDVSVEATFTTFSGILI